MKWAAIIASLVLVVMAATLTYGQRQYSLKLQAAEQTCRALALSYPDMALAPAEIACTVVHDDILLTFEVNAKAGIYVDCLQDGFGHPMPRDCSIYRHRP